MHLKFARAYDYLKREQDRIPAAHVKILAQKDRRLERRLFRADLDSSRLCCAIIASSFEVLPIRETDHLLNLYIYIEQLGLYDDYLLRRPWSLPKVRPTASVS